MKSDGSVTRTAERGMCLETIRRKKWIYAASSGFGFIASLCVFLCFAKTDEMKIWMLLVFSLPGSGYLAYLWGREHRRLKIAHLIAGNPILHIRTAVISGGAAERSKPESVEIFVSYFGILLDSKIIKFNQEGVLLKAVEVGRNFISFRYGTDQWMRSTRLLLPEIPGGELEKIRERFRYETGIMPLIVHGKKGE